MLSPARHFTRCLFAGTAALLPIVAAVVTFDWIEGTIAGSWLANHDWYYPGMGMLMAVVAIYVVGLLVTNFIGRWLWRTVDRLLVSVPLLGSLYQSLKQLLGYDSTRERFFQGVVACPADTGYEIGFITGHGKGPDGTDHTIVFVPSAPNPTSGKLLLVEPSKLLVLDVGTSDALRALVSLGKSSMHPVLDTSTTA